jgi:hypothetical protein
MQSPSAVIVAFGDRLGVGGDLSHYRVNSCAFRQLLRHRPTHRNYYRCARLEVHADDAGSRLMPLMSVAQCVAESFAALNANRTTHIAGPLNQIIAALIPSTVMRQLMGTLTTPSGQS